MADPGSERPTLERRSFLLSAGAAVSAGLTSAALLAAPARADAESRPLDTQGTPPPDRFALLQDTQAIRALHRRFGAALNEGRYEDIVDLFADESQVQLNGGIFSGKQRGVRRLYVGYFGVHAPAARAAASGRPQSGGTESTHAPVLRRLLDEPEALELIEVAADRRAARARFRCLMQAEAALAMTGSLADMARQQGQGVVRWWESGEFENAYLREGGVWKIQSLVYRASAAAAATASATATASAAVTATVTAAAGAPPRLSSERGAARPRDIPAFSRVYPQDPMGPDALVS